MTTYKVYSMHDKKLEILRLPEVINITGLSRATIYNRIADGDFPMQILLGGGKSRAVGWVRGRVEDWITEQIKLSTH